MREEIYKIYEKKGVSRTFIDNQLKGIREICGDTLIKDLPERELEGIVVGPFVASIKIIFSGESDYIFLNTVCGENKSYDGWVHPHVCLENGGICLGEQYSGFTNCMEAGLFEDAFSCIDAVLSSYNKEEAFKNQLMDFWDTGIEAGSSEDEDEICPNCGYDDPSEYCHITNTCEECQDELTEQPTREISPVRTPKRG